MIKLLLLASLVLSGCSEARPNLLHVQVCLPQGETGSEFEKQLDNKCSALDFPFRSGTRSADGYRSILTRQDYICRDATCYRQ